MTEHLQVGDTWSVVIGALQGERQILAMHENTVELCAPTSHMSDCYRWHEVKFASLLRRLNGKSLVMP
ncbi:MAG: hypothetical protein WBW93_16485 [Steroidobacteraceae bacterium]